jgi:hypothetical protein
MKPDSDFRPHEILCIELCVECEETFLYSEVIQVIPNRQLCWVRPIVLTVESAIASPLLTSPLSKRADTAVPILYDLRQGSDLLCPSCLFRPALDTEVIPLLTELGESKLQFEVDRTARLKLQAFVRQVWQAHPDVFGQ